MLCFDKTTGKQLWEREAHRGVPKVKRHPKSTHANSTAATDGKRVVAFFGSEGLHCYDLDGKPLWKKDFGVLDSGFFVVPDAQWGFASSPVLFEDKVIVLADVQKDSFLAALDATNGEQLWRTPRNDVPTWGTPTVHRDAGERPATQVIVNGFKEIAGYDFADGKKLWTMSGGGDIPVPTPIVAHDLVFITSAHGPQSPIYAIKPTADGRHHAAARARTRASTSPGRSAAAGTTCRRRSSSATTSTAAATTACSPASTPRPASSSTASASTATASPPPPSPPATSSTSPAKTAASTSIKAGPTFEHLAENELGEQCLATPALSDGVIFFRTQRAPDRRGRGVTRAPPAPYARLARNLYRLLGDRAAPGRCVAAAWLRAAVGVRRWGWVHRRLTLVAWGSPTGLGI